LGTVYGDQEASLMANDEIASALIEGAPGATFVVWVDPKYEYDGVITIYAPDLGRFDAESDSDGNIHHTNSQVRRIVAIEDIQERRRVLGTPWEERIDGLRRQLEGTR